MEYYADGVVFVAMALAVCLLGGVVKLALYVVRAMAMRTLARRRGLAHSWVAWVPLKDNWLLGSISDQYQYLTQEKEQNRRKILAVFAVVRLLFGAIILVSVATLMLRFALATESGWSDGYMARQMMGPVIQTMIFGLLGSVVGVAAFVFRTLCWYDLYRSCDPKNAVGYLVLSMLFRVTEPFFLLACSKKDLGMPPRRPVTGLERPEEPGTI